MPHLLQVALLYTHHVGYTLSVYVRAAYFILPIAGMDIFVSGRTFIRAQSLNDALKPGLIPKDKETCSQHGNMLPTYVLGRVVSCLHGQRLQGGVEIELHSFLTSTLNGDEWSTSHLGWFTPTRERTPVAIEKEAAWPSLST